MTRNTNTNDDEQIENSTDDQNADADAEQEQGQDAEAEQDGAGGAEQDVTADGDVDRFGGTCLSTSDLTELTPFDAEALSEMSDSEVAYLAEKTAQNHATDGSREAYIDAITATLAQVEPDHEWTDSAALRDHADDVDDLQRVARLIENGRGVSVVERAEGNVGPRSDGTLANHRARQEQNAHANAASGAGNGVNTNAAGNGGGDFGLNPQEWRDDDSAADDEGPATTGTLANYRDQQSRMNTNADDGAPPSLRVGQRTVYHGEDAYYAEVRRRKKKGDWPHPEPSGFHKYRKRTKLKNDENSGV